MNKINQFIVKTGILILSLNLSHAQQIAVDGQTFLNNFTVQNYRNTQLNEKYSNVKGSPYINDSFSPVKISGYGDVLYNGRFNAYNGEMEIKIDSKIIALPFDKKFAVIFVQSNHLYKNYSFKTKEGKEISSFLNVVSSGKDFELLKYEKIKFHNKKEAKTSYDKEKPANFKREKNTYYLKRGSIITFLSTKKKIFFKVFPKHSLEIKNYVKQNKLSLKKESDLIKIMDYVESIY